MRYGKAAFLRHGLFFFLVLLAGVSRGRAADSFTVAPPAGWIEIQKLSAEANPATNSTDENIQYILLDDQVNVSLAEHYHRIVEEPVNANCVQNCVQLSLDYDPSYQHLIIHDIVIRRETNVLNRLEPQKIKVIQQEKDLDMNIFNGEVSAVIFLEDVQVGDQIDYSYTVCGSNPIFAGHFVEDFYVQWSDAVTDQRFRLLWPTNRILGIRNHGTDTQPVIRQYGSAKEYVWELHDIPAVDEEDLLPAWYEPDAWVQLSDFASWREVAEWAVRLYPRPEHLDPQLQGMISQWQQSCPTPEARLAAALAFVQDDVRYMGIEVGPNSHQPNDPSLVFARRFGDCKDKAYLFCTLLQAMNIPACEALVDTDNRSTVQDWLPSPYAFDHVVSQVQLDGKTYWLDPTELLQGGTIDNRFFPDYGRCLLVRPGTGDLTVIPQQRTGWPKTTVQETFVVHGQKDPADFTVRTLAEGADADDLRDTFANQRRDELQKNYLNYYAREYPKIKLARPLEVIDHREQNTFETIEHYRIQEFWTLSDNQQNYNCEFYPQSIRDLFDEPTTTLRSMPLAITWPRHYLLQTKVILPEDWPLTNETDHFECEVAQLDFKRNIDSTNIFRMEYEYQTLTNFVSPAEMPAYVKTLGKMKDALGYSLTWENENNLVKTKKDYGRVNWMVIMLAGSYLIVLVMAAIALCRVQMKTPPVLPNESELQLSGIGGWLILPMIGLFISPIMTMGFVVSNTSAYAPATWHAVTDPSSSAYNGFWAPLLIFELLVNLTTTVFAVLLLVLFFQRHRHFPRLYVTFLLFCAATAIIDHFGTLLIPAAAANDSPYDRTLIRNFTACAIWIPYMLSSRRVKATFIR